MSEYNRTEALVQLYGKTLQHYEFYWNVSLKSLAFYYTGTGLLYAFYISHQNKQVLLWIPFSCGIILSVVLSVGACYIKYMDPWLRSYLDEIWNEFYADSTILIYSATPEPFMFFLFGCSLLTAITSSLLLFELYSDWLVLITVPSLILVNSLIYCWIAQREKTTKKDVDDCQQEEARQQRMSEYDQS